ncbi:VPLPA-CTERM sorting domain-containing protein [Neotabrizicola sp. sgz301269]|uniref:VPLPA-CTERM sorting domain-containing protein n=1 Tax=Neotabrizicola sp. sgz301269 TaxID=3276282 RepID=UPI0037705374
MMLFKSLAVAAALALPGAAAQAATINATEVVNYTPGTFKKVEPGRADASSALGAADGSFVSLGLGGSIVLAFATPFRAIGEVVEITYNNKKNHKESADIFASVDGITWTLIASVKNYLSTGFSASGVYSFLKIVDTTGPKGASFDGFDIDSVSVTPVPVPAAGLLLGGALLGLGSLRRRKTAA